MRLCRVRRISQLVHGAGDEVSESLEEQPLVGGLRRAAGDLKHLELKSKRLFKQFLDSAEIILR